MKRLLFLAVIANIYTGIFAMNKQDSEAKKRKECTHHRIIRGTCMLPIRRLVQEARNGDVESQFALQELNDSCKSRRSIILPPSRKKLTEIKFLDENDRVHHSICDAISNATFAECYKFDKEAEEKNS